MIMYSPQWKRHQFMRKEHGEREMELKLAKIYMCLYLNERIKCACMRHSHSGVTLFFCFVSRGGKDNILNCDTELCATMWCEMCQMKVTHTRLKGKVKMCRFSAIVESAREREREDRQWKLTHTKAEFKM